MIKSIIALFAAGLLAAALLPGCTESSEHKVADAKDQLDNAGRDLKVAQTNYADEWQTFKGESEKKISDNQSSIDRFKEKMEKPGSRLKAKYRRTVAKLERENTELKGKMSDYKDDGQDKWEAFKSGFDREMDRVTTAVKDLTAGKD